MTTIADVRTAMADAIETTGLNASAYQTDAILAPCAHIRRGEMDPRLVLGSSRQAYAFVVRIYTQRTLDIAGQEELDEWCAMSGATSLRAAIELDTNWPSPAIVNYAQVTRVGETEVVTVGGDNFLTVDFDVEVVW